ncbi:hypothetical protein [Deinococcus aestuarii]|uniref:hypothetical protein n=1 Tax=Deinococcus aestuarii TaxID=2774531 RepID=UPI001C0DC371|nr:hypothetical protein [Deinococcus aestuarii]
MGEQVTLDAEFLRRALGESGDLVHLEITPGSLPLDFPVTLPDIAGFRVLGGVRSVTRPTFSSGGRAAEQTLWRLFLDVPGPQPDVMAALTARLAGKGWRVAQMWRQAFVEASADRWMCVHPEQARTVTLQTRGEGAVTQVALTVQDAEPEQVRHLLGQDPQPNFHRMHDLPLPTLVVPLGWRVQMQGGGGGETERSERAVLVPPEGADEPPGLLAHFSPQLERQGWRVRHVEKEDGAGYLTARTGRGIDVLTLSPDAGVWQAVLLHVALGPGGQGSAASFYTLSS